MNRVVAISLSFAASASLAVALVDLAFWYGYQGFEPATERAAIAWSHVALIGAIFATCWSIALVIFFLLRRRLPSVNAVAPIGAGCGPIVPHTVSVVAIGRGWEAALVTLVAGTAAFAGIGGSLLGRTDPP